MKKVLKVLLIILLIIILIAVFQFFALGDKKEKGAARV